MAILDKENRPRGLRVPSFARKGFKQKSSDSLPDKEPEPVQAPVTTVIPPRTDSVPDYSAPAPLPAAVQPPSSSAFNAPIHPQDDLPQPAPPAANYTPASRAYQAYRHAAASQPVQSPPARKEVPVPAIQRLDAEEPLEDFIPEPEPELDDTGAPIEPVSSEENNGPWTPPDIEPVAAPLNKLHFACYQDHRSMPPANNVWHAVPCMTCQKFDRDVRYRCVFCCLRICTGCFQTLQTIPRRSLTQLMESIPAAKA